MREKKMLRGISLARKFVAISENPLTNQRTKPTF